MVLICTFTPYSESMDRVMLPSSRNRGIGAPFYLYEDQELFLFGLQEIFDEMRCAGKALSKPHPQMLHEISMEQSVYFPLIFTNVSSLTTQ
nr:MAG: hypothetical protein BECKLFY1418A_GA0070994_100740 [Candidatus Kentron sp. LFY]